jgi:electron transport complex protein RnfD
MDLFTSHFPGIIADRGVFALLLGTIIITASQVNRSWIPAVYLAAFGILVRFAGALPFGSGYWNGDVIFALCSGGTLAAAFLLAAEPATGAKSNIGIFLAALSGGCIAFVFRWFGNEPYGAVLTAVVLNAILPIFRVLERRRLYKKQGPQL